MATTDRLWLTDPRRTTCLARVVGVHGGSFALDRSLFAPTSRSHRHPQQGDRGTVWCQGEKRRLQRTFERGGVLWHTVPGLRPLIGAELNCHLDAPRRKLASRAHTAMHLFMKALWDQGGPPLVTDPEVKGGGQFRLDLAGHAPPRLLADALSQANRWVQQGLGVRREFMPRGLESQTLDVQRFQPPDAYPGPADTLALVRIEGVAAYPCDGTHVDRTSQVGRIEVAQARAAGAGMTLVVRVGKEESSSA